MLVHHFLINKVRRYMGQIQTLTGTALVQTNDWEFFQKHIIGVRNSFPLIAHQII